MGISQYIKEIGRGKQGARPIDRAQAADLFGQVLDGTVTDLEIGAFCLSMRIKGETPDEMAGFLDATYARLNRVPAGQRPLVVLPSYNGARRLPVLTPLLASLVARPVAQKARERMSDLRQPLRQTPIHPTMDRREVDLGHVDLRHRHAEGGGMRVRRHQPGAYPGGGRLTVSRK